MGIRGGGGGEGRGGGEEEGKRGCVERGDALDRDKAHKRRDPAGSKPHHRNHSLINTIITCNVLNIDELDYVIQSILYIDQHLIIPIISFIISSQCHAMSHCGAVVWLHGLGDSGAGWKGAFGGLSRRLSFHHPDSPVQPVTIEQGARMPSWFDIAVWPLGLSEPEGPQGIDESVQRVHGIIAEIESKGIPSHKILVGGFSQGGALSILAGLTYPRKLAGVASISGWCAYRTGLKDKVHPSNAQLPMLLTVGTGDPIVTLPLTSASGEILKSILGESFTFSAVKRGEHQPALSEMQAVGKFIESCLE